VNSGMRRGRRAGGMVAGGRRGRGGMVVMRQVRKGRKVVKVHLVSLLYVGLIRNRGREWTGEVDRTAHVRHRIMLPRLPTASIPPVHAREGAQCGSVAEVGERVSRSSR